MNKPAYFFDISYLGSDVIVDNFATRGYDKNMSCLGEMCGLNNKYAVRAKQTIAVGETIEIAPFVIVHNMKLSKNPHEAMDQMTYMFVLEDYSQYTKDNGPSLIIAGGYCPFYSHSHEPNAYMIFDHYAKNITIRALKIIPTGHEITLYRFGSYHVMKNNMEIQKFYQQRQDELKDKNVNLDGFRSMSSTEIKNIDTIEVSQEQNTQQ